MIALRSVRGRIAVAVMAMSVAMAASAAAAGLDDLKDTSPAERAAAQTTMMKSKLSLTDDQLPKIKAINERYAEQMDPIIKGSDGLFTKMGAVKQVEDQKEGELQGVLSKDQFSQFLAMKTELRDKLVERIKEQRAQKDT
jgi:hypothetical protein